MNFKSFISGRKRLFWLCVMLFPILVFFINLVIFSVNIPYNDDYPVAYIFMFRFLDSRTWLEHFNILITSLNVHHQLFCKLINLLQYYLLGNVSVRLMQIIGNAGLLVIIWIYYRMFGLKTDKIMFFVPAVFLFFQTGYSENSFFGVAALTNFYVMVFGYLSILILDKKSDKWVFAGIAFFLSVFAYFTQENGILFLLTGIFLLLERKQWGKSAVWFLMSLPVIFFYRNYTGGGFSDLNIGHAGVSFAMPKINLLYFFYFIGNCFGASFGNFLSRMGGGFIDTVSRILPVIAGIIITAYFVFLGIIRYDRKNPALFAIFLFLILTAFGAMIQRGGDFGVEQAITSRYRVLTIQFIIIIYLSLAELLEGKAWPKQFFTVSLICSIVYCSLIYLIKYEPVVKHRDNLIISLKKWEETDMVYFLSPTNFQTNRIGPFRSR